MQLCWATGTGSDGHAARASGRERAMQERLTLERGCVGRGIDSPSWARALPVASARGAGCNTSTATLRPGGGQTRQRWWHLVVCGDAGQALLGELPLEDLLFDACGGQHPVQIDALLLTIAPHARRGLRRWGWTDVAHDCAEAGRHSATLSEAAWGAELTLRLDWPSWRVCDGASGGPSAPPACRLRGSNRDQRARAGCRR